MHLLTSVFVKNITMLCIKCIKKEIDWDEFSDAIINCRREEVLKYVSDYTEIIKAEKIPDEEYLKLMAMTIILRASSTLNKYGTNIYQLASEEEVFQNVREIRTIDDTVCYKIH